MRLVCSAVFSALTLAFASFLRVGNQESEYATIVSVGIFLMLWVIFFHLVSIYSSETQLVNKRNNGAPEATFYSLAKFRSNIGVTLFFGGLALSILLIFGARSLFGIVPFALFMIGFHLFLSKMCPYCKKINNFTEHSCRNCGNGLDLFDS